MRLKGSAFAMKMPEVNGDAVSNSDYSGGRCAGVEYQLSSTAVMKGASPVVVRGKPAYVRKRLN